MLESPQDWYRWALAISRQSRTDCRRRQDQQSTEPKGKEGSLERYPSEVRLPGFRDVRVLVVVILVRIFGADRFGYLVGSR